MELLWWEILLRMVIAGAAGFVIGLERERHHRPAGIKTHIMVCLGAAVVSMMQIHMIQDVTRMVAENPSLSGAVKSDMGRLGAQVISGIGFLGAGTILQRNGSIKGLTTAATLWLSACLGLAIGMGYYWIAGFCLAIVMVVLIGLRMLQGVALQNDIVTLEIKFTDKRATMEFLHNYFVEHYITVQNIEFISKYEEEDRHDGKENVWIYHYTVVLPRTLELVSIQKSILMEEEILRISEVAE